MQVQPSFGQVLAFVASSLTFVLIVILLGVQFLMLMGWASVGCVRYWRFFGFVLCLRLVSAVSVAAAAYTRRKGSIWFK
jgi:hypothetical protein